MYGWSGVLAVVRAPLSPIDAGTGMPPFVSDILIPVSMDLFLPP